MSITPITYSVNNKNHAIIGGVDVMDLAETYGTPLYVLDEATIRAMAQAYTGNLKEAYPGQSLVIYAGKANLNMGICKLMEQEGLGLDVVSGGELFTAIQAGFPMEQIFFNGNNKSMDEITMALHNKVGRITVDNLYELSLIHRVAKTMGVKADVLLRVTPGIDCHTHDYIRTGHTDSKFGLDMSYLSQAIELIMNEYAETIQLRGLHAHVGSQIFETQPYVDLAQLMLNIYYNIRQAFNGFVMEDLNLGGGLGVAYTQQDDPPNISDTLRKMTDKLVSYAQRLEYPLPRLLVEPGRSMIATAGVTIYTVGSSKEVPGVRKYIAVDGGMGDNIRPALYQAEYSAIVANRVNDPLTETVRVAGKYCESGDILIRELRTPSLQAGDLLMVLGTGAYNYTMASNYNRVPRPAVVMVENGNSHVLVKAETYETLIQQDLIPLHLLAHSAEPREVATV
jgi:diaminopimelate decarboxylase